MLGLILSSSSVFVSSYFVNIRTTVPATSTFVFLFNQPNVNIPENLFFFLISFLENFEVFIKMMKGFLGKRCTIKALD